MHACFTYGEIWASPLNMLGGSLPAPLLNINLLPVRLMEILRTFSDVGDGLEHAWFLSMHASYSVWLAGQIKYCPNWPLVTRSDTVS